MAPRIRWTRWGWPHRSRRTRAGLMHDERLDGNAHDRAPGDPGTPRPPVTTGSPGVAVAATAAAARSVGGGFAGPVVAASPARPAASDRGPTGPGQERARSGRRPVGRLPVGAVGERPAR